MVTNWELETRKLNFAQRELIDAGVTELEGQLTFLNHLRNLQLDEVIAHDEDIWERTMPKEETSKKDVKKQ